VGDVNLSHSAQQSISGIASNSIRTMSMSTMSTSVANEINASIITEMVGDVIYAYVTLDPLQQNVVGTQFQINYDNSILKFENVEFKTKGNPMNYGTNRGTYVNVGSLITDGSTSLDKTTEYIVKFTKTSNITNVLGLISVGNTEAVNQSGQSLKIKIN
jgi:hypothetical protein